jgi:hypothetical protein
MHCIIFKHNEEWQEGVTDDPRDDITGKDCYELLKCAGCGHVVFRHTMTHSQNYDKNGNLMKTVIYSPPKQIRKKPRLLSVVAGKLQCGWREPISNLLDEIYIALHSECPRLAAMGIRALLEHIMIDKAGDCDSFRKNIDAFKKKGFMSESEQELIETALEVGHASIHRNYKPAFDILISALDITESLINKLYLFPLQAKAIRAC